MSVRVLYDPHEQIAALFCSTSDVAFGPIFNDDTAPNLAADEAAIDFLEYLEPHDAREYTAHELEERREAWLSYRATAINAAFNGITT